MSLGTIYQLYLQSVKYDNVPFINTIYLNIKDKDNGIMKISPFDAAPSTIILQVNSINYENQM